MKTNFYSDNVSGAAPEILQALVAANAGDTAPYGADPGSERLLGAFLVGAEAGELVHVFAALMRAGASARAVVEAEFVHPTFAEGLQSLVMRLPRYALR